MEAKEKASWGRLSPRRTPIGVLEQAVTPRGSSVGKDVRDIRRTSLSRALSKSDEKGRSKTPNPKEPISSVTGPSQQTRRTSRSRPLVQTSAPRASSAGPSSQPPSRLGSRSSLHAHSPPPSQPPSQAPSPTPSRQSSRAPSEPSSRGGTPCCSTESLQQPSSRFSEGSPRRFPSRSEVEQLHARQSTGSRSASADRVVRTSTPPKHRTGQPPRQSTPPRGCDHSSSCDSLELRGRRPLVMSLPTPPGMLALALASSSSPSVASPPSSAATGTTLSSPPSPYIASPASVAALAAASAIAAASGGSPLSPPTGMGGLESPARCLDAQDAPRRRRDGNYPGAALPHPPPLQATAVRAGTPDFGTFGECNETSEEDAVVSSGSKPDTPRNRRTAATSPARGPATTTPVAGVARSPSPSKQQKVRAASPQKLQQGRAPSPQKIMRVPSPPRQYHKQALAPPSLAASEQQLQEQVPQQQHPSPEGHASSTDSAAKSFPGSESYQQASRTRSPLSEASTSTGGDCGDSDDSSVSFKAMAELAQVMMTMKNPPLLQFEPESRARGGQSGTVNTSARVVRPPPVSEPFHAILRKAAAAHALCSSTIPPRVRMGTPPRNRTPSATGARQPRAGTPPRSGTSPRGGNSTLPAWSKQLAREGTPPRGSLPSSLPTSVTSCGATSAPAVAAASRRRSSGSPPLAVHRAAAQTPRSAPVGQ
eukprot:TRINITY_DN55065_c0_g1_i2.p1 TRINITY_DN55065_c0_g1~~TRINITY_DN55065_c0_g1_i2.p1  ORF type:complete len:746 (+),score=110.99 TRINITY_DN55065_c0_g1_i2:115-2238(+)